MQYMPADTDSVESNGKLQILMQLCTKPMQKALYFCTGSLKDEALFRHYALSVPFYTHFTSPIRRYPDVMVHRLLAASLGTQAIYILTSTKIMSHIQTLNKIVARKYCLTTQSNCLKQIKINNTRECQLSLMMELICVIC